VVAAAAGGGAAYALHGKTGSTTPPAAPAAHTVPFNQLPGSIQAIHTPSTALPGPNWTTETVQPSQAGTTAGFSIDIPPGWTETRSGLVTDFQDSNGDRAREVDRSPHTYDNMLTEARYIKQTSLAQGRFPGYYQVHLEGVPVRNTNGAFWQFTWTRGGTLTLTDDILFIDDQQSYAVYFRAPDKNWNTKFLPQFKKMLSTFQVVQS